MYTFCEKKESGTGEYAGIPVLLYVLSVPQIEGDRHALRRINRYYERLLNTEISYAQGTLTSLAGSDFDKCMAVSHMFQQFELRNEFICEADEETELLVVRLTLTAFLGRLGAFTQSFTDIWDLRTALPASVSEKEAPAVPKDSRGPL